MIRIANQSADIPRLLEKYPSGSVEAAILQMMAESDEELSYSSEEQLHFELVLRKEIIAAAEAQYRSGLRFKVFRDSFCNPAFWMRTPNGGFSLRAGAEPYDAVRDIFENGHLYGTECATAMMMIYYGALSKVFPRKAFNRIFSSIYLMNWHRIDRELEPVGSMRKTGTFLPGDRRYFANPDVDPVTPEWQGENVIDMGRGLFYGHGVGKHTADVFVGTLNRMRRDGADESAYLMDLVGRPNFKKLFTLYERAAGED